MTPEDRKAIEDRLERYEGNDAGIEDVRTMCGQDVQALLDEIERLEGRIEQLQEDAEEKEVQNSDTTDSGLNWLGVDQGATTDEIARSLDELSRVPCVGRLSEHIEHVAREVRRGAKDRAMDEIYSEEKATA